MDPMTFLEALLLAVLLPAWLAAGFADYLCHAALRIEKDVGWREPALHALMLVELAIGLAAVLLLEVNALVIALFAAICLVHEVTLVVDLSYASKHRQVPAFEQWVHGVQHAIPWMVLVVIAAMRPDQALALLGVRDAIALWMLQPRVTPWPLWYLLALAIVGSLLVGLPFLHELGRSIRFHLPR
ncbi:MAG TPA: diguanylate cyclase [Burkholderiales bacterium]|nr:diguanylate cyclase [Burkholderiales bacterium]